MANNVLSTPYIDLDLFRWQQEEVDITSQFKGHVGDVDEPIRLRLLWDGLPFDVRGAKIMYGGSDPNAQTHSHWAFPRKEAKQDNLQQGRFTLYLDRYTFKHPGKWDQFYFKVIKGDGDDQQVISTVNVKMYVIEDVALMHIGEDSKGYWQDMVDLVNKFKSKEEELEQQIQELSDQKQASINQKAAAIISQLQDLHDKCRQEIKDAIAEIDDPKTGLMARYETLNTMAKQIQETLKLAQFHDRIFQYENVEKMKAAILPLPGDLVVTQGWEARDDARGGFWRIRVKRDNETANGTTTIELGTGYIAERDYGIVEDMEPIHMGTVTYEAVPDASGFVDQMPPVHMYVSKYGAGIAQVDVDIAGGSAVSEVKVQPVFDGSKCEIYISPADIRFRMPDINLETPSSAECDGPNVYVVSNIYTLTLSLKGAKATGFTIDKDFITEYRDLMTNL